MWKREKAVVWEGLERRKGRGNNVTNIIISENNFEKKMNRRVWLRENKTGAEVLVNHNVSILNKKHIITVANFNIEFGSLSHPVKNPLGSRP